MEPWVGSMELFAIFALRDPNHNDQPMITATGFDELKNTVRYLEEVPFDVTRKNL